MSFKRSKMIIPGSIPAQTNPLPQFRRSLGFSTFTAAPSFPDKLKEGLGTANRILPYEMQDRYSRSDELVTLETFILENKRLRATFTPGFGGKLWSLFDKKQNRELLFANTVCRPGNLAIRNAWTSGGIEWNFGNIGHHAFTCSDVFAAKLTGEDGEEFVRIYEYERMKECVYQADFHLPKNADVLFAHVKVWNPNDFDTTTYWWTNIAVPEDGHTRVLSSTEEAIILGGSEGLTLEKLPNISVFPGDMSYPLTADRSYDYFFQCPDTAKTAWEASADKEGNLFFNLTTAPLLYHKMFCWGSHASGQHWQEYLSEPGKGYYVELQSGYARSQLHDRVFKAGEVIEWTQCFGGTAGEKAIVHGADYSAAGRCTASAIAAVMTQEQLLKFDAQFAMDAKIPVCEKDIFNFGSGWGALENKRRARFGEKPLGNSVCFPDNTLGDEQAPWLTLLQTNRLPVPEVKEKPASWMISEKWRQILENSMITEGCTDWYSLLHDGVMLYEKWENARVASEAKDWQDADLYAEKALDAWKASVEKLPSAWAYRNIAVWWQNKGDVKQAQTYYEKAMALGAAEMDFAFAVEYLHLLSRQKLYADAWRFYSTLPQTVQKTDRVMLTVALAGLECGQTEFLQEVFTRDFADIREGECSLTDLWFRYQALLLARQRQLDENDDEVMAQLVEEATDTCPPPASIDFRQSVSRTKKYQPR